MSDSAAVAGRLEEQASSSSSPGVVLVSGLVPDGVQEVVVHVSDGSSQTLAVVENVYAGEVTGGVRYVSFEAGGSEVRAGGSAAAGERSTSSAP
jgi:hypothetical protein